MQNLRTILKLLKKYKKFVIIGALLVILESVMELLLPTLLSNIVNIGIGNKNISYTIVMIIIMSIITLISMISGIFSTYYLSKATGNFSFDVRNTIMTKISKANFISLDKIKVPNVVTIINNDIPIIESVINMGIRILVRLPIVLLGSIIISFYLNFKLSLILLIVIPLMILIMYFIMKKVFPYFDLTQNYLDEVNSHVRENISGIKLIKSYCKEKDEIKKFNNINQKLKNINIKAISLITYAMPTMFLIVNITTILILWYGGNEIINNNFSIGNVMALIQYLTSILTAIMSASMILVMLAKSETSAKRINELINIENDLKSGNTITDIKGKIEFKNVSFEYEKGKGDYVLKDINLVINPGEHIGIVGVTGSGKSSLVNLIARYYDVSLGKVLIDDKDIKEYDLNYLRNKIKICQQKAYLFSGTILDNIKCGNENITIDKINESLKMAEFHKFATNKKEKLNYIIEQKGENLSGGEKQRLSLARTLASNPEILIIDDVTRSLDLKTDKKVRTNLKKYFKNKTLLVISSRISLVIDFDKIIVVNDGEIESIGTHEELLKKSQIYKEIYNSQLKDGEING